MTSAQLTQRRNAGRIGGLVTRERYGNDYLKRIGCLGGRPRLSTLAELQPERGMKEEEVAIRPAALSTASLSTLLRLYRQLQTRRNT
jgi:hypothetical protein